MANENLQANLDVAKRLDITCRKGDTFQLSMEVNDDNGDPIDFSLYTSIKMQVRESEDDDDDSPVFSFEYPAAYDTSEVGKLIINKTASDMANVQSGLFVYDLQLTDQSNKTVTWFYGIFRVNDDITI